MRPLEGEHHSADRPGLQHILHGLLLHQSNITSTSETLLSDIIISVHSGLGQVLVHVGALLLRGLLHNSPLIRLHLP